MNDILKKKYLHYYEFFTGYKDKFLRQDIKEFLVKSKLNSSLFKFDYKDIEQELACKLFEEVKRVHVNQVQLDNPELHYKVVVKNHLKYVLSKKVKERKRNKLYMSKMETKKDCFYCKLDSSAYSGIRELFKQNLTIRENVVIHLRLSGYSDSEIADCLRITEDYVGKLFRTAEQKLRKVLGL